jgi:cobalt-zinc-cadmium efflux system membrane fusion protein
MKKLLWLFFLTSFYLQANENQINLSRLQRYNLGIKVGGLTPIEKVPLLNAFAIVTIPPNQDHIVSTSQAGLVNRLYKTVGDKVKKGQLLAQIDSYELLALQRDYLHAYSEQQLARIRFQRDQKLLEGGIIAYKRLQSTRARYNSTDIDVNATRQLLVIAGMSAKQIQHLTQTQQLNSQFTIYAPMSGVILKKMGVEGQRLDRLAPLYRIANLTQLWLEINIPQEQVSLVKINDLVTIKDSKAQAQISLLAENVNVKNQSVLARAVIKNQHSSLKVGQNVNINIHHSHQQIAYQVPNVAIAQRKGVAYIFVQIATGFLAQPVKIIGKQEKHTIIISELTGSEQIALRGAVALKASWIGLGDED